MQKAAAILRLSAQMPGISSLHSLCNIGLTIAADELSAIAAKLYAGAPALLAEILEGLDDDSEEAFRKRHNLPPDMSEEAFRKRHNLPPDMPDEHPLSWYTWRVEQGKQTTKETYWAWYRRLTRTPSAALSGDGHNPGDSPK